jgi:hypothetical protein
MPNRAGFPQRQQRRDSAPAQANGLGFHREDHPSPERAYQKCPPPTTANNIYSKGFYKAHSTFNNQQFNNSAFLNPENLKLFG